MISKLHTRLRRHHRSYTQPREQVYLAIARLGPCTKQAVVRHLAGQVDAASVYRAVDLFIDVGVVHVLRYHLVELSDDFRQHHHHFVCRECQRESNFNDDRLERALTGYAARHGLKLESHQVELSGLCARCAGMLR